jgi:hypothetical protein
VSENPNRKSKRADKPIPLDRFGNPFPPRELQAPKVLTGQDKFLIALPIILKMGWKLLLIPALFFGFPIVVVVAFLIGEFFVSTRRQY